VEKLGDNWLSRSLYWLGGVPSYYSGYVW